MTTTRRTKKPPKDRAPESIEEDVAPTQVEPWGDEPDHYAPADDCGVWGFADAAMPEFATVRGKGGRHGA